MFGYLIRLGLEYRQFQKCHLGQQGLAHQLDHPDHLARIFLAAQQCQNCHPSRPSQVYLKVFQNNVTLFSGNKEIILYQVDQVILVDHLFRPCRPLRPFRLDRLDPQGLFEMEKCLHNNQTFA